MPWCGDLNFALGPPSANAFTPTQLGHNHQLLSKHSGLVYPHFLHLESSYTSFKAQFKCHYWDPLSPPTSVLPQHQHSLPPVEISYVPFCLREHGLHQGPWLTHLWAETVSTKWRALSLAYILLCLHLPPTPWKTFLRSDAGSDSSVWPSHCLAQGLAKQALKFAASLLWAEQNT